MEIKHYFKFQIGHSSDLQNILPHMCGTCIFKQTSATNVSETAALHRSTPPFR